MTKKQVFEVTKPMHNPVHPGHVLKETVLKGLNLKVGEAAEKLDVDRTTLSRLINGHIALSVDMAMRLHKALDTAPQFWLNLQRNFDLAQARKRLSSFSRVQRFTSFEPTVYA